MQYYVLVVLFFLWAASRWPHFRSHSLSEGVFNFCAVSRDDGAPEMRCWFLFAFGDLLSTSFSLSLPFSFFFFFFLFKVEDLSFSLHSLEITNGTFRFPLPSLLVLLLPGSLRVAHIFISYYSSQCYFLISYCRCRKSFGQTGKKKKVFS